MKRDFVSYLVIILLGFLVVNFLHLASAQDAPGVPAIGEVPGAAQIEKGQQTYEQYTTAENKTAYLTQQWGELLGKAAYIGPVFRGINAVFNFLNPFFRIVLGYGYGLSWAFLFALSIWLILFLLLNPILSKLMGYKFAGIVSAFIIASLIGLSGVIKLAVDMLVLMVTNIWIAVISLAVAGILVFLASKLGKMAGAKITAAKKAEEERKTAEAQQITQTIGEVKKRELESYKETI